MTKDIKQAKNNSTTQPINIHEEYLQYHEKYIYKYGPKTIILMQIGSFYECYSTDTRGPNLFELSDVLNIICTRKDKSVSIIDEKNPYMLGFNCAATNKFLKLLVDNNYTVVTVDQTTQPPKPKREVTNIFSPSTYIDNISTENKYLMILYFETNSAINSTKSNVSVGMCAIDSTLGDVYWYESHGSGILNENEAWEEAQRFYHYYRPVELIIYQIDNTNGDNQNNPNNQKINIGEKIDIIPNQIVLEYKKINPEYTKLSFQNKLFKKVYPHCGMDSPISFYNLDKSPYATIALTNTFDYIYQHNQNLINELKVPKYFNEHKYMVLGNNAQYQLNIVDYYNWDKIDSKFHSLNAVVNNCCTPMGKRNLKQRLCAPFTNIETIQNHYNQTEKILQLGIWENIRGYLKEISDLDKLFRKMSIKYIQPYELYSIYKSLQNIVKIIELVVKSDFKKDLFEIFSKSNIKLLEKALNWIENKFNIEQLKLSNLNDIKISFYLNQIYPDLDELVSQITGGIGMVEKLSKALEEILPESSPKIKHNDADGYYLTTSKIRGEKLEAELKKQKKILKLGLNEIKPNELEFKYLKHTCKISYQGLADHSDEIDELYSQFDGLIKKYFINDCAEWFNQFNQSLLKELVNMLVHLDLITNNAFTSSKYHYVKPVIKSVSKSESETKSETKSESISESYIHATNLRHPIIERIIDYEYVPHNVKLDEETKGNLIYGYNGVGKSSIMKGIGLNLILAQCGMYVSAESFEYGVFESLYTRISGNDNLFKGQSSFIIEMNELRTILKKANSTSLIIGDEVCRGTEYLSANAIVASAILKLNDLGAKFLFATHLHELAEIDDIKAINTIKFFHLSVEKKGDELIFNRSLKEGTGEQIYGITVAQYILDDPLFINKAIEIKNNLLEKDGINTKLLSDKKSLYNKEIYMDACGICGGKEKLESHHINMQKDFVSSINGQINAKKKHIVKDSKANLIVLCSKCHDNLHSGNFTINGLAKTTSGVKVV
jgi:DNA mismatch repair protein MutS